MIRKKYAKRVGVCALSLLLGMSSLFAIKYGNTAKAVEDTTIESPTQGDTVTWDCIYFGSYPQGEVTEDTDRDTYHTLQSSKDWNTDDTLTIDGDKYKRIQKEDATSTGASYRWSNDNTYHYFKFEPIKWRVMDVTNTSAYLISDLSLDTQKYNQEARDVSWNSSSLRSWLNGYDESKNQSKTDYRSHNFLDTAFESSEKNRLISTKNDKVTILSEEDLKNNTGYGFSNKDSRTCKASAYAQAMGAHLDSFDVCNWWTSDNGNSSLTAKYIQQSGEIYTKGYSVAYAGNSVRVAVTIDLTQTDAYQYAGTVSSDGTINEVVPTTTPSATPDITSTASTSPSIFTATPTITFTVTPTQTATATPSVVPTKSTTTPTAVPVKTATVTTAPPTATPHKTATVTTPPTVVPHQTAPPVPAETPAVTTTATPTKDISKGSAWYDTASNTQYRILTIGKSAGKDGTIGTVAYVSPIKTTVTTATIPAKVTIEQQTFKVTTIGTSAFSGNKKLKKVVIGKNVKKINANAFKGCKNLKNITIQTTGLTKSSIGKHAFKSIHAKATIKVPSAKLKNYKKWIKAKGASKTVVFRKIKSK